MPAHRNLQHIFLSFKQQPSNYRKRTSIITIQDVGFFPSHGFKATLLLCALLLLPSGYFHYKQKHHVCDPSSRDCMSHDHFLHCATILGRYVEMVVLNISVHLVAWNLVTVQLLSFVLNQIYFSSVSLIC